MQKYNLISIGDHCTVPEILRKLELRTCSYPFDWIAKPGLIHNTNIPDNFEYLFELMETHDVVLNASTPTSKKNKTFLLFSLDTLLFQSHI